MVNSENTGARLKKWFGRNFGNNAGDRTFHVLNTLIFLAVGFIALYPFLYVFVKSLQAYDVSEGVQRITYSFSAYKNIFADDGLIKTFLLSVAVVLAGTLCNVAVTYACAYALSKKYLKGRTLLLIFVLIPMLFSGGLMPTYILIRQLNLKNNPLVYILPSLCSSFNVIIVKNFLHSVPESMEEARRGEPFQNHDENLSAAQRSHFGDHRALGGRRKMERLDDGTFIRR